MNKALIKPFVFLKLKRKFNSKNLFKFIPLSISSDSEVTYMNKFKYK